MISKSDWKLFREKLPEWQEKYMEKSVDDLSDFSEELQQDVKRILEVN